METEGPFGLDEIHINFAPDNDVSITGLERESDGLSGGGIVDDGGYTESDVHGETITSRGDHGTYHPPEEVQSRNYMNDGGDLDTSPTRAPQITHFPSYYFPNERPQRNPVETLYPTPYPVVVTKPPLYPPPTTPPVIPPFFDPTYGKGVRQPTYDPTAYYNDDDYLGKGKGKGGGKKGRSTKKSKTGKKKGKKGGKSNDTAPVSPPDTSHPTAIGKGVAPSLLPPTNPPSARPSVGGITPSPLTLSAAPSDPSASAAPTSSSSSSPSPTVTSSPSHDPTAFGEPTELPVFEPTDLPTPCTGRDCDRPTRPVRKR